MPYIFPYLMVKLQYMLQWWLPDNTIPQAVWNFINKSTAEQLIQLWSHASAYSFAPFTVSQHTQKTKIYPLEITPSVDTFKKSNIHWPPECNAKQRLLLLNLVGEAIALFPFAILGHLSANKKTQKIVSCFISLQLSPSLTFSSYIPSPLQRPSLRLW